MVTHIWSGSRIFFLGGTQSFLGVITPTLALFHKHMLCTLEDRYLMMGRWEKTLRLGIEFTLPFVLCSSSIFQTCVEIEHLALP
eukprot:c48779_g1_i1 orf=110-361(+)